MNTILFVNHRTAHCGVQQFGRRYWEALSESQNYVCHYIDIDHAYEFHFWIDQLQPALVLYNFYSAVTMPWLTSDLVAALRIRFKQLCFYHELPLQEMGFDLILHQNPISTDTGFEYLR
ncbi:MAG TPA: hypothetical protein VF433_07590, partial [Cellvibrio sp.]